MATLTVLASTEGRFSRIALPIELSGDTVTVFGPRRFAVERGSRAVHVERIQLAGTSGTRYRLIVRNGAPDGSGLVQRFQLRLNGQPAVESDARGSDAAGQLVELAADNTLEIVVEGPTGSYVTVSVLATADPTYAVYGPREFTRGTTAPMTVTERFSVAPTATPPYGVHVTNGAPDGSRRVSSAVVRLNGATVIGPSDLNQQVGILRREVALRAENVVEVELRSAPGSRLELRFTATDVTPPVITLTTPNSDFVTNLSQLPVAGSVQDETATRVTVNGIAATVAQDHSFTATVPLEADGPQTITVEAVDAAGNHSQLVRTGTRDTQAPALAVESPADGMVTNQNPLNVTGFVTDATPVHISVNGLPTPVDESGLFAASVSMPEGQGFITVTATDAAGNGVTIVRSVTLDTRPPLIALLIPAADGTTDQVVQPVQGTATDQTEVTVTVNGGPVAVGPDGGFVTTVALVPGPNPILAEAVDAAGNTASVTRTVTLVGAPPPPPVSEGDVLPIDSTIGAPALGLAGVTTLGDASRFLYEGNNPLQTGVVPGAIAESRVAVIRGRVLQRDSTPLPGVTVSVQDRPEFGSSRTRDNGVFDLAVNGGGPLVLQFERPGLLPVQRHLEPAWRDYEVLDDVVMIALDASVTMIDFTAPAQVARGSVVTDEDGTRRATALFKQGTTATAVLPDGSQRALPVLHVRGTEYTVGALGPEAMPGELPPTNGYTYAVELSADEAIAAGATTVRFNKPVPVYVENFLNLDVGALVPVGFYDRERSEWLPSEDALVVKLLGVTNGLADLDTDGSGTPADNTELGVLGIDDAERQAVAGLYVAGQSLWRERVTHFSPGDINSAWDCVGGDACTPVGDPEPDNAEPINQGGCQGGGSIIECQNQTLGEGLPVIGARAALNYRSDRTPGRAVARQLSLRLVGATVPRGLQRVDLHVDIAGRRFSQNFSPAPDLRFTYAWDGRDAYGRTVQGTQPATVRIGYTYRSQPVLRTRALRASIMIESFAARSCLSGYAPFAQLGPCQQTGGGVSRSRSEITLWRTFEIPLGTWDARGMGLGGWTVDPVHFYDNVSRTVYLGDGTRRRAESVTEVVRTVAGSGVAPSGTQPNGDGGPATATAISPQGIAIAPDGSMYFGGGCWVRRVDPAGTISTVVGARLSNCLIFPGGAEGVRDATTLRFGSVSDVVAAPDNSIYFTQPCAVWRLVRDTTPQRLDTLSIVAGYLGSTPDGSGGFICGQSPEGSIARGAKIGNPFDIALVPDGSLYIGDSEFGVIRRVGPDGRIHREITNLTAGPDFAYAPDGSLYFHRTTSGGATVRRLSPDGLEQVVAGNGTCVPTGQDGVPARQAGLCNVLSIAVDAASNVYVGSGSRIRVIGTDGIITTLVGTGTNGFNGDGRVGLQTQIFQARRITVGPNGAVYFTDQFRVRQVAPTMPGFSIGEIAVPSADGSELYRFTSRGRHLETVNTLTGAKIWQFAYDTEGRLESLTDGDGNITRVIRDGLGQPAEIVAPFGQRTALTTTSSGYLASITNPAGERTQLTYGSGGLLATMTNPLGHTWRFEYDVLGRLTRDSDPAGGSVTLAREDSSRSFGVTKTTALGLSTRYGVQRDRVGTVNMANRFPSGAAASIRFSPDAIRATTLPDGSVASETLGPDPRWGLQAPLATSQTYTVPGGLSASVQRSSRAQVATSGNPLSLVRLTDTLKVNSLAYVRVYDAATREVTVTSPEGRRSRLRLDTQGRLAMIQPDTGVDSTVFVYNSAGQLTERRSGSAIERLAYDAEGYLSTFTDALGRTTRYARDAAGRVANSTSPGDNVHRLGYDASGRMTSVTMPNGAVHGLGYSPVGINTSYTPPGNAPYATVVDADRRWASTTLPSGRKIEASYDAAGRIVATVYPEARVRYEYVGATQLLSRVTRTAAAGDSQVVAFTYQGSLPTRIRFSGAANGEYVYTYDHNFRVTSRSLDGGPPMQFTYDRDGLLVRQGPFTLRRDGPMGAVSSMTDGRLTVTYTYDRRARLIRRTHSVTGTVFYDLSLTYDAADRVITRDEIIAGEQRAYRYSYDADGRLVKVIRNGVRAEAYEYDENGNRTRREVGGVVETASYDAQDRIVNQGDLAIEVDEDGFLRRRGSLSVDYSARGELLTARVDVGLSLGYSYDAFQRVVAVTGVTGSEALFYGNPSNTIQLTMSRSETGVVTEYVYDEFGAVTALVRAGRVYYVGADVLGTPLVAVDDVGNKMASFEYDAWGNSLPPVGTSFPVSVGFGGGIGRPQPGSLHFGFRDYDPVTARWTTRDPVGFAGRTWNLYAYVGSNPVGEVDPFGLGYNCFRPLEGLPLAKQLYDKGVYHVQYYFEDGRGNIGFFPGGLRPEQPGAPAPLRCEAPGTWDDRRMWEAMSRVNARPYSLAGLHKYNCQDWMDDVRQWYWNQGEPWYPLLPDINASPTGLWRRE